MLALYLYCITSKAITRHFWNKIHNLLIVKS